MHYYFQDIEKKYPGFIHMKLLQGIRLSYNLQMIVQNSNNQNSGQGYQIVRGCRVNKEGDLPTALNGYLYSVMKTTKSTRRAILTSLLKQFDESAVSTFISWT